MDPVRHLKISFFVLLMLISGGTAGYMSIEGWRPLDAAYMTVITLGTVGFKEVHDLSDGGKLFTMCLIVIGVSRIKRRIKAMLNKNVGKGSQRR